jgi:hypothetical protein
MQIRVHNIHMHGICMYITHVWHVYVYYTCMACVCILHMYGMCMYITHVWLTESLVIGLLEKAIKARSGATIFCTRIPITAVECLHIDVCMCVCTYVCTGVCVFMSIF